jgi:phosphatidylserine/phosphatidylglycerophosphate/cardiolipin synthase-like enzyme
MLMALSLFPSRLAIAAVVAMALASGALHARERTPTPPEFEIVQSVPEATMYGEDGVRRTQTVWLEMIRGATNSIDIAAFYIADKPGSQLSPVLDALADRAKAGVKVRILVDQTFLAENHESVDRFRALPGFEIRVLPVKTLTGGVLHAKYMVVDGTDVFVGSQNWDWRALSDIHEIGARIRNRRFAQTFDATFDFDWQLAGDAASPRPKGASTALDFAPVTVMDPEVLNARGDGRLLVFPAFSPASLMPGWVTAEEPALVDLIKSAQHIVRVQVMTLSALRGYGETGWWAPVDTALRDAAARGVEVHIIVADWALHEPMQGYLKSLSLMPHITVKFSRVPPSPSGFIPYARVEHAKYAVIDDRSVFIGTGNWESSYFHTSVDASVFVRGAVPAGTMTRIFERDWSGPYVTTLEAGKTYVEAKTH